MEFLDPYSPTIPSLRVIPLLPFNQTKAPIEFKKKRKKKWLIRTRYPSPIHGEANRREEGHDRSVGIRIGYSIDKGLLGRGEKKRRTKNGLIERVSFSFFFLWKNEGIISYFILRVFIKSTRPLTWSFLSFLDHYFIGQPIDIYRGYFETYPDLYLLPSHRFHAHFYAKATIILSFPPLLLLTIVINQPFMPRTLA